MDPGRRRHQRRPHSSRALPGSSNDAGPKIDVTAHGAQHAVYMVSDWLSGVPELQVPMPSPNAANNSSAKKTPDKKTIDLGPTLAKRRSQDFASKIHAWDGNGAGVVQLQPETAVAIKKDEEREEDEVASDGEGDMGADEKPDDTRENASPSTPKVTGTTAKASPKTPVSSKKTARKVDIERKAWVRKRSKPQVEIADELKQATTPKKRVVSDGHWRRDRLPSTPELITVEAEKEAPPKPVIVRRSVVSVGLKVPPSVQDFVEESNPGPVRIRPLRHSRSKSRSPSRERTADYEDSGVKVYIKRRRRSRTLTEGGSDRRDARTSESSLTAGSSVDKPRSATTDLTTPSQSPTKETSARPATAPKLNMTKSPFEAADNTRRPGSSRRKSKPSMQDESNTLTPDRALRRDQGPRALSQPVSSPVVPATPQVYGSRIEGWLAGTSDPFVESRDASLTPEPLEILKTKPRKTAGADSGLLRDDNGEESRKNSHRRRRSRPSLEPTNTERKDGRNCSSRSLSPVEALTDLSGSITPTLQRRGARRSARSPVKERMSRDSTPTAASGMPSIEVHHAHSGRELSNGRTLEGQSVSHTREQPSSDALFHASRSRALTNSGRPLSASSQHVIGGLEGSVLSRASDGDNPRPKTSIKRRLTKHSDLISVLSLPRSQNRGVLPARSISARRPRANSTSIGDLMNELTTEELKYQRELRTLVDGVIPVLLTHVLQKGDPSGAKRLFSGSSNEGQAVTRPIVEMGVCLERLKATHKRIPLHDPDDLLRWANGASKAYDDYLKAWRLGFQDLVVNLAPAEGTPKDRAVGWDAGMALTEQHRLENEDRERVDVAYLLKRPLVRLKYLTKTFQAVSHIHPSAISQEIETKYHELVVAARRRANDERARLEDEAATNIDPTRARDPYSLVPLSGVTIDATRSVRARDYYDMDLLHSSGQQITCKIEIIMRDDAPERGDSGDILFCEVSTTGRWLLFPPVQANLVSARPGEQDDEIVIMIRGQLPGGREWREVISMRSDDDGAITEWLEMLSSVPIPSRLSKKSSFNLLQYPPPREDHLRSTSSSLGETQAPSASEVEVPIGEQANPTSQIWDGGDVNSVVGDMPITTPRRMTTTSRRSAPTSPATEDSYEEVYARHQSGQDRANAIRSRTRYHGRPVSSHVRSAPDWATESNVSAPKSEYSVWLPSTHHGSDESSADEDDRPSSAPAPRPSMRRRTSSVPSVDLPTIPKIRRSDPLATPRQPTDSRRSESIPAVAVAEPASAPAKLRKQPPSTSKEECPKQVPSLPSPLTTRPASLASRTNMQPTFTPTFLKKHRRSSSPLKHEYEPSTASESLEDSDSSDGSEVDSITSESSAENVDEAVSTIGELKNFYNFGNIRPRSQPNHLQSSPDGTLGPSESASQAPYRTVPPTNVEPAKTVACIFSWADRGAWDSLHPEECSIFVTPGLIEAFDLAQAHAVSPTTGEAGEALTPSARGVRPLVALELTPLVPLRRGTALDISIRSPPTSNSVIRMGNNVMFRSRSPEECEKLYNLINRARIDNPTYIALQNARGPVKTSNWAEVMDKRNAARTSSGSSWWQMGSRKSSTYRSNGSRATSTAATDSSIGTMNTAFSALRRFSSGSRIFNIAKSTITSREGTRSTYSDSLSSGVATPVPIDPRMGTPVGITNAKIRLYIREAASKWRDMGSARLTVMIPPRQDPSVAANPKITGLEKRILICGKGKGPMLLDATLGESCFERVARTGIAVSVWEESIGPNGELGHVGAVGGVASARSTVYMVQMKSERDAAYTFGLVGKLRY